MFVCLFVCLFARDQPFNLMARVRFNSSAVGTLGERRWCVICFGRIHVYAVNKKGVSWMKIALLLKSS